MTRKDKIKKPFSYSTGEQVFELIGKSRSSGNAARHSFSHAIIPASCSSRPHYHLQSEETFHFTKGNGRMIVDERKFDVGPGDTVLISPKEKHQVLNNSDKKLEFIVVCAPGWNQNDCVFLD
jgi:mannose-6-phosphate isomerase-like protein (cupin superfamily)